MRMLALTFLFFTTSTFAQNLLIFETRVSDHAQAQTYFNVNQELGRAWVEILVGQVMRNDPENMPTSSFRALVPGLSFDSSTNTIVLEQGGELKECARVRRIGGDVFNHNVVTPTNCRLTTRKVLVSVDTGFEIRKEIHLQVFLVTK